MKIFLSLLGIITLVVLLWFVSSMHKQVTNKQVKPLSHFVTRSGMQLELEGKPFRSIGVNRYNLLTQPFASGEHGKLGCADTVSETQLDSLFKQFDALGITTVRFWLFQSFTKSGAELARFNYVIDLAKKHKIKLIPVLENHWDDCTQGGVKDANWYSVGYKAPYGNYQLSLKQYLQTIIPLYKNESTILAWEIMNEAQSTDEASIFRFAQDLSQEVKSLDTNHLVSFGTSGMHMSDNAYLTLGKINTVDFLEYHDYYDNDQALPVSLQARFADARKANKPLIMGESGMLNSLLNRDQLFGQKIYEYFKNGGSIYLIWSYGEPGTTDDGYNFSSTDPVAEVVRQTAQNLNKE